MSGDPHPVFQDGVAPQKSNARAYLPLRLGNPDALRALDGSSFWLVFVASLRMNFYRDTSDTTSEDNGASVIVDAAGQRWKAVNAGVLTIDAAGDFADRSDYDEETPPFAYYAIDDGLVYVKMSATSAHWSAGFDLRGPPGIRGPAGTIDIASVTTGAAGSSATIENVGTPEEAVLNIQIPRGDKGDKGDKGDSGADLGQLVVPGSTTVGNLVGWNAADGSALQDLGTPASIIALYGREKLTANRTYYVRTDGNDANSGLVGNAGGAFLTIAKAVSVVRTLDLSIYNVTIQLGTGTWVTGPVINSPWIGGGTVTLRGDPATPANVVIAGAAAIQVSNQGSHLVITGITVAGTTVGIIAANGGSVTIGPGVVFDGNPTGGAHIRTNGPGSQVLVSSDYTITSGAGRHFQASPGGFINAFNRTITLVGSLNFSVFADCDRLGLISCLGTTSFTGGTITGKRYNVGTNGVILVQGGGANFFPGSSAGTTATGGQYS